MDPFYENTPVQVSNRSWVERSTGSISQTITNSCARNRHRRADRGASGPFMWKAILDTRVLIAEDLGAAPAPLVLAQVEC